MSEAPVPVDRLNVATYQVVVAISPQEIEFSKRAEDLKNIARGQAIQQLTRVMLDQARFYKIVPTDFERRRGIPTKLVWEVDFVKANCPLLLQFRKQAYEEAAQLLEVYTSKFLADEFRSRCVSV